MNTIIPVIAILLTSFTGYCTSSYLADNMRYNTPIVNGINSSVNEEDNADTSAYAPKQVILPENISY